MIKEHKALVSEYVGNFPDPDLCYLGSRLTDRSCGDLGDALNFMSQNPRIDEFLGAAVSAEELYDNCDYVRETCAKELKRRNMSLKFYFGV